jgi:hypothetical protein
MEPRGQGLRSFYGRHGPRAKAGPKASRVGLWRPTSRQRGVALHRHWSSIRAVTLSSGLRYVDLTLECELCGHLMVKRGVWFMTASTFKFDLCKGELRLTYSDKVALFAKHLHLA